MADNNKRSKDDEFAREFVRSFDKIIDNLNELKSDRAMSRMNAPVTMFPLIAVPITTLMDPNSFMMAVLFNMVLSIILIPIINYRIEKGLIKQYKLLDKETNIVVNTITGILKYQQLGTLIWSVVFSGFLYLVDMQTFGILNSGRHSLYGFLNVVIFIVAFILYSAVYQIIQEHVSLKHKRHVQTEALDTYINEKD